MNVITTDTINVWYGCTSWQGDELAGRTSYHTRQHRLCSHTKFSPPSSSDIFCCNGIWIMNSTPMDELQIILPFSSGCPVQATSEHSSQHFSQWTYHSFQVSLCIHSWLTLQMMIQSKTGFEGSHNVGSGRVGRGGTGQTTNLLLAVWHFVLQNLGFSSFNLCCWQGALEVAFWRYS